MEALNSAASDSRFPPHHVVFLVTTAIMCSCAMVSAKDQTRHPVMPPVCLKNGCAAKPGVWTLPAQGSGQGHGSVARPVRCDITEPDSRQSVLCPRMSRSEIAVAAAQMSVIGGADKNDSVLIRWGICDRLDCLHRHTCAAALCKPDSPSAS